MSDIELVIKIPKSDYRCIKEIPLSSMFAFDNWKLIAEAIANGIPLDEKELKLKRWIEKDIETLNYIIESGWLISDLEKCTAIDACEDAITALKQYPVLDKVRAEIAKCKTKHELQTVERDMKSKLLISDIFCDVVSIIDKYRGNVDEI